MVFLLFREKLTIDGYDELMYYLYSLKHLQATWSPLYSLFYALIHALIPWISTPYAVFWFVSGVLFPAAVYGLARRITGNAIFSAVCGGVLFLTHNGLGDFTKVHVFNFSVLTLSFLGIYRKDRIFRVLLWFLVLGLSIHLRMENLILAVVFLSAQLFSGDRKKNLVLITSGLLAFSAGALLPHWNGKNVLLTPNARVIDAFRDHYRWAHPRAKDFQEAFPEARSVATFAYYYPGDFLTHVGKNVAATPEVLLETLRPWKKEPSYLLSLLFLIALSFSFAGIRLSRGRTIWIFLGGLGAEILALNWIFHPWERYLAVGTFGLLIGAAALSSFLPKRMLVQRSASCLLVGLILWAVLAGRPDGTFQKLILADFENLPRSEKEVIILPDLFPLITHAEVAGQIPIFPIPMDHRRHLTEITTQFGVTLLCTHGKYEHFLRVHPEGREFLTAPEKYGFRESFRGSMLACYSKL